VSSLSSSLQQSRLANFWQGLFTRVRNRRHGIKTRLAEIIATLGPPGASHRAAQAILRLLPLPKTSQELVGVP